MRKKVLLLAAIFTLAANAIAGPVTQDMARIAAARFWAQHHPADVKAYASPKVLTFGELDQLYILDMEGLGFVILPADDRVMPILAYSFENPFPTELNRDLAYWLGGYNAQIAEVAKSDMPMSKEILHQWNQLLLNYGNGTKDGDEYDGDSIPPDPSELIRIPAMLTTFWDQGNPYNEYCPYDSVRHDRTVVGCVATAMAQIMKYWNYPSFGQGSNTYQPPSMWYNTPYLPVQSVDFANTTYLWQLMSNRLENFSPARNKDAVATLSYHCGVAVNMMYGVSADGGSGAYSSCGSWTSACATDAFVRYFKYDSSLYHADRWSYTEESWRAIIDEQLELGQPIYYSGSDSTGGHAFVLDGADIINRYHFNWGWSGYGNGYYTVNNLAPTANGGGAGGNATMTFNRSQGAIFGIKPGIVEVFDTVDYYDSICDDSQYIQFREYTLAVAEMDTLLRHIDTIFNYHLRIISKKRIFLNSNMPNVNPKSYTYCPATGYTFPECTFVNEGYNFVGWCRSATGDDTIYQPGQHINLNKNESFFALWLDKSGFVGITEVEEEAIKLWPNPATEELSVSLPYHTATLTVLDALGRTMLREDYPNLMGGTAKINLSSLPSGHYTLQIRTSHGTYNQQIIKL